MTKAKVGGLVGEFTWCFGQQFFIETVQGNFTWNDPEYDGDGVIKPFNGSYKDWLKKMDIPFGRGKGKHIIKDYCGDFIFSES